MRKCWSTSRQVDGSDELLVIGKGIGTGHTPNPRESRSKAITLDGRMACRSKDREVDRLTEGMECCIIGNKFGTGPQGKCPQYFRFIQNVLLC